MLDIKAIRAEPNAFRNGLARRGEDPNLIDQLIALDERRRRLITENEALKKQRNEASRQIGARIKAGEDPGAARAEVRRLGERIEAIDQEIKAIESETEQRLLALPNLPDPSVPEGASDADNQEIARWGEPRAFDFEPLPHWELGAQLGILDLERAAKVAGANFYFLRGAGARLERALIAFMLDLHTREHGYTEWATPYLVNRRTLTGTGQLPKFESTQFHTSGPDLFLIPTAEVPVTNLHAGEILDGRALPLNYCAATPCFRHEQYSHGRESRGITRVYQFNKVELVKFTTPESSWDEHERLRANAEEVLRRLGIPYRVVLQCTGDLGFASAKTYDLEAWAPGMKTWLEVSSISNFLDFQARRADIRFRREPGAKPEFLHTLNGSALALPRTLIALMENYQRPDGSILIPDVLRPFMGTDVIERSNSSPTPGH
ncbi:MAG: serine--tRNA ligase [Candidatus Sumerlaeia bacterium]